jgi:phage terminase small subunit
VAKTSSKRQSSAGLNARQRLFAHEVLRQGSAAAAYFEVYGCAKSTAETNGPALLRKAQVAAYVESLRKAQLARVDSKAEEVLAELRHVALGRLSRCLDIQPDGSVKVKPLDQWTEHELAALTDVDVEALFEGQGEERYAAGNLVKLKMRGKQAALEALMKHHGLLKEVVEHRGSIAVIDPYAKPPAEAGE